MSSFYRLFLFSTILLFTNSVNAQVSDQDSVLKDEIENISLKFNLEQGIQYRFINNSTQKIIIELTENPIETNTEITTQYLFEIVSNTDEGLKIRTTYEQVEVSMKISENDQSNIDTDLPQNEQNSVFYPFQSSLINQPFYLFVNHEGKLIKTEGLNDIVSAILNAPEMKNTEHSADSMMIANLFSDLKNSFHIFPKDSVSMGSTWTAVQKANINKDINIDIKQSFTLESLSEDLAWINIDHKITNNPAIEGLSLTGTQKGTIELEKKSGLILYSDVEQEIEGQVSIIEFIVPIKISSTTKITGEKL